MVPQRKPAGNDPPPQSEPLKRIEVGGAIALAVPGLREAVAAMLAADVPPWRLPGFEVIKERTVRTVACGLLGAERVHLKVYRADRWLDRARDALRGPRGTREFERLAALRSRGFPAVEPLAHGMVRVDGELRSFVVTKTVPNARALDLDDPAAATVGALLRRLHDAGERPQDLHPDNVLVDDDGKAWLIDLANLDRGGVTGLADRAAALARLCEGCPGGPLDPAAKALLGGYRAAGAPLPEAFRDELILAARRQRAAGLASFGRRAFRACRHTEVGDKRRGQPRRWRFLPQDGSQPIDIDAVEAFACEPASAIKQGRRGGVWLTEHAAVKRRDAGAARKLWLAHYWLLYAQVAAPMPLALRIRVDDGRVFAARLPGPSLAEELRAGALDALAWTAAATALGGDLGRLHAHGLRNRDLKFDNLVRNPTTNRVAMVDLDGVRRKSTTDARGVGADLGRLLAAFDDAGRPGGERTVRAFLRAYVHTQRRMLHDAPLQRILMRANTRAREWRESHS
ncbi:MAG: hypothetical protein RL398_1690 [Planctomycetota bacterium]